MPSRIPLLLSKFPSVVGTSIAVDQFAELAAIDVTGYTLGTRVYVRSTGAFYTLAISPAATDGAFVAAVAGNSTLRWKRDAAGWSSDLQIDLVNASGNAVPGAVGVASSLSNSVAGQETAITVYTFALSGTIVTGCTMTGNGLTVPGGAAVPSYAFASPSAGGTPGYGYDDNQPALIWYVNNRKHLMYGNALLMDPGAAPSYGLFADQSQATGISVTLSGALAALKGVGVTGMKINATGMCLYSGTPVAQPSTTGTNTGFTAGAGTAVNDQSTFTGGTGTRAYRISDIVLALKQIGAMATN